MGKATSELAIERPHSLTVIRRVYVLGLVAWLAYVVSYPSWIGRIYPHSQGVYGSWNGATFKLDRERAPLWSPPFAYCGRVRWPWQSVSQDSHVELRLVPLLFKSGLGAIVLGVVLRLMHLIVAPHHADRLVCMAWSVSLTLTIALICLAILGVFSMGYAWTDTVVLSVFSLGVLGGVVYGAISCLSPQFRLPTTTTTGENHTTTLTEKVPGPSSPTQPWQMGNALLAFIAGLLVAVGITIVASRIAASFRGPKGFFSEFATAEYAKPQGVINLTTGIGIAVTGWIGGVLLLYRRVWRGFAIGLLAGTTFLGILFALQYAAVLLSLLAALIIGGTFGAAMGRGHLLFMLLCAGMGVALGLWAIHVFPPDVIWIWVPMLMGSAWGTVAGRGRLIRMLLFAAIGGAIGLVTGDVLAGVTGEGLRMAVMNTARDMGFPFVFPILIFLGSLPGAFLAAVTWIVQRMLDRRTGLRSPLPVRSPLPGNVRQPAK